MPKICALKKPNASNVEPHPAFPVFLLSPAQQSTPLHLAVLRRRLLLLLYFYLAGLLLLPCSEHGQARLSSHPGQAAGLLHPL